MDSLHGSGGCPRVTHYLYLFHCLTGRQSRLSGHIVCGVGVYGVGVCVACRTWRRAPRRLFPSVVVILPMAVRCPRPRRGIAAAPRGSRSVSGQLSQVRPVGPHFQRTCHFAGQSSLTKYQYGRDESVNRGDAGRNIAFIVVFANRTFCLHQDPRGRGPYPQRILTPVRKLYHDCVQAQWTHPILPIPPKSPRQPIRPAGANLGSRPAFLNPLWGCGWAAWPYNSRFPAQCYRSRNEAFLPGGQFETQFSPRNPSSRRGAIR